jgi:GxxExxY protein
MNGVKRGRGGGGECAVANELNRLTEAVIGAAIDVHRAVGPGLLESAYEECMAVELRLRGLAFQRQHPLPVMYKGNRLECAYRVDLVVEQRVAVELKAVEQLQPIHEAQLLTYLRLGGWKLGLLLNFHAGLMRHGIRRLVLGLDDPLGGLP